jgi:hypothetical protein
MTEQQQPPSDTTPSRPPVASPNAAAAAPGPAAPADAHELGANEAKAYVPPTTLVPRNPQPAVAPPKVKIAEGVDPRHAKTEPRVAQAPVDPTPGTPQITSSMPATPFEPAAAVQRPAPRPAVGDGVLPFVKPAGPVQPPPAVVAAPVAEPHDVVAAPAPAAGPVLPFVGAAATAPSNPAAGAPAPAAVEAPASAPAPQAAAVAQPTPPPASAPAPGDGSSPWTSEHKLDVTLLPSASLDFLPPVVADEAAAKPGAAKPVAHARGSRTLLIVGLAVAAVLLVVGIVLLLATRPSDAGGPTSVGAGSDGTEPPDEPTASAKPTAVQTSGPSASTAAPRPVPPRPQPTRRKGFDPYDLDL